MAAEGLAWYRAVTLSERVAGRTPSLASPSLESRASDAPAENFRAEFRLSSWKGQRPFDHADMFRRRLEADGLTEEGLRRLVEETPRDIARRMGSQPPWIAAVDSAMAGPPTFGFHAYITDSLKSDAAIAFLDLAAPFIDAELRRLTAGATALARGCSNCPFDPKHVAGLFFPQLAVALKRIVRRTMVLELNVARLEGRLDGSSPEERFVRFIEQLHERARLSEIFEEYPVLARLIVEQTRRFGDVTLELLGRLVQDVDDLERAYTSRGRLGFLEEASHSLADSHTGGRSVVVLRFGSGLQVVYKPKSLAVDRHFQELLGRLSESGFPRAFRTLTILDRGAYGWSEFASPAPCRTRDEVLGFYERTGALLALLYVTQATDVHSGNLIACGEHPLLVDLEALFHAHQARNEDPQVVRADRLAARCLRESVLSVGLLPERLWSNQEHEGVDISGLGGAEGQLTPHAVEAWEDVGGDTMRFVRKRRHVPTALNRPVHDGAPVDARAHRDAIARGFRCAYGILAARREELLSSDGPLRRFGRDEVTVFLRSSRTYRRLLRESYHPDVLRDAIDRDRLFDLLWIGAEDDPGLARVIPYERDALWNGEIPSFAARPEASDLSLGGRKTIEGFLAEPALAAVRRTVNGMGELDCDRQVWLIEASFAAAARPGERPPRGSTATPATRASHERILAAAVAAGERLERCALRGTDDASWIGLELTRHGHWSIGRAGLDLDAGVPGIALFLAYLGEVTAWAPATKLAQAAVRTMRELVRERQADLFGIGGFEGWGGVIHALSHLGALWGREDLVDEADALAARLTEWLDADEILDVFGGAAGFLLALRSLNAIRPSDRLTDLAIRCGDHVIGSLRDQGGDAMRTSRPGVGGRGPGILYGAVGIAHALRQLASWTGLARFQPERIPALSGAGPTWVVEASNPAFADHSLETGDLGRVEALAFVAALNQDSALSLAANEAAGAVVDEIEAHGFRCGTPLGVETPGLLTGLSGIGYGLLRAAQPDNVPSVLALESPRAV